MKFTLLSVAAFVVAGLCPVCAQSPKPRAVVGAYYFDGWSGKSNHVTPLLKTKYADRMPVWGWLDDTVDIMQKQIDFCADHDVGFWAFDWYYPEAANKTVPENDALELYLKAANRERLKFCLMVANHAGFRIGRDDWEACCEKWIELFRDPNHLRLDGKPLLIILLPDELKQAFHGVEGVRQAFDTLRSKAKKAGIPDVAIAGCVWPGQDQQELVRCDFTLLTGYNYALGHRYGVGEQPFRKLIEGNQEILNDFGKNALLPYVPVVTAGWDRRPWEEGPTPITEATVSYTDRTPEQVEQFVSHAVEWLDNHPDKTPPQRLIMIYAWNENGEGGYLTPTAKDGTAYLKAVQRAITAKK